MAFHYLAIEGPIGVGKTRLAERLAHKLEATTILEDAENPFLADFYADRPGSALQAQLFYLLNRHRQLTGKRQADLFLQTTICDYVFDKDKIFAYLNLDEVIRIIRNEDDAKAKLIARFRLNDVQAEAILNTRLRQLRKLEEMEIRREDAALREEQKDLQGLLAGIDRQLDVERRQAHLLTRLVLLAHVAGAGPVVAHQDRAQARRDPGRPHLDDALGDLGVHLVGHRLAGALPPSASYGIAVSSAIDCCAT